MNKALQFSLPVLFPILLFGTAVPAAFAAAPVAQDVATTTAEDLSVDFALTASDADGDTLTFATTTSPANGTLSFGTTTCTTVASSSSCSATVTYTPNQDFNGTDTFTFVANDGVTDSNVALATISVTAVNDAPVARDALAVTNTNTPVVIDLTATDVDSPSLTFSTTTSPVNGTLGPISSSTCSTATTTTCTASVTYTPNLGFTGLDAFTFLANDGLLDSNVAVATITVVNNDIAPIAQDVATTTAEDFAVDITLQASDADGDALVFATTTSPANGTLGPISTSTCTTTASSSSCTATVTYTPNADFNGTDTFMFKANDGILDSNIATSTIIVTVVNDAPVARDTSASTTQNVAVDVTLTATDVDSPSLMFATTTSPANGTLGPISTSTCMTATTTTCTATVMYTPNLDFTGLDTFAFLANDGLLDSNVATATIAVVRADIAPVAEDVATTTAEDFPVDITLRASDADGDALMFATTTNPANGTLGPISTSTCTTTASSSSCTASVTYTPNANFNGTDMFNFVANDGILDSNVATSTIIVTAVNDAPVAFDAMATTTKNIAVDVTLTATDVDGDTLMFATTTSPANGTLGPISSSTCTTVASTSTCMATVMYTPNIDFSGTDTFNFLANDGFLDSNIATATIAVINDIAPVAEDVATTTAEDFPVDITLRASDVDGDTLTFATTTSPANGTLRPIGSTTCSTTASTSSCTASVTYTPNANFNGTDVFMFKANDGILDSNIATSTITVTAVNDAPAAADASALTSKNVPVDVTLTASDVDGDSLVFATTTSPANGTLGPISSPVCATTASTSTCMATTTYTPNLDFSGTDTFNFLANDGLLDSNIATATITVINDIAPVAADATATTTQDAPTNVTLSASDADGDALVFAIVLNPANGVLGPVSSSTCTSLGSTSTCTASVTYSPNVNFNGTDLFTFKANDGQLDSNVSTATITVAPVLAFTTVTNADGSLSASTTNTTLASTTANGILTTLTLPATTTITGPATWNGTVTLPVATTAFTLTPDAGNTATAIAAVEVGAADTPLTLDNAALLTFGGQAGTLVGWSQAGVFHPITAVCDSATTPTLADGADCKIDVGSDLFVWTKHFTAFVVYTQAPIAVSAGGAGGGGGGGGGGGSISPVFTGATNGACIYPSTTQNPDVTLDGVVDLSDFERLMIAWGTSGVEAADITHDCQVDLSDFEALMIGWS